MSQTGRKGVLSGWDKVEADIRVNINDEYNDAKDIYDILDIIADLRAKYHITNPSRELLLNHVADPNAHNVIINIDGETILDAIYANYLSRFGNRLTKEEFVITMFKVFEIATREDYDSGTSDLLMNLKIAKEIIDEHLNADNPHPALVSDWFPGAPVQNIPRLSFQSGVTSKMSIDYQRDGDMFCHDINGDFVLFSSNEIPVDYLTGLALTPLFGPIVNRVAEPESMDSAIMYELAKFPSTDVPFNNPRHTKDFLVVGSLNSLDRHEFRYDVPIQENELVNMSLYYRKLVSTDTSFSIDTGDGIVNVRNGVVTSPDGFPRNHFSLPNGWNRVDFTTKSTISVGSIVIFLRKDNQRTFQGTGVKEFAFYLLQITNTATVAPPLPGGYASTINPGMLSFNGIRDVWNPESGILSLRTFKTKYEFEDINSPMITGHDESMTLSFQVTCIGGNMAITTVNDNGARLTDIFLSAPEKANAASYVYFMFGFARGHQGYGFTDNAPHVFDLYGKCLAGERVSILSTPGVGNPTDAPFPYEFDDRDFTPEYSMRKVDLLVIGDDNVNPNCYISLFNYYHEQLTIKKAEFLINQDF